MHLLPDPAPAPRAAADPQQVPAPPLAIFRAGDMLAVLCATLVVVAGGLRWSSAALAVLAALACRSWVGSLLKERSAAIAEARRSATAERERIGRLCTLALPVWTRQLETARAEGNAEIAEASQAFGQVAQRCETVLSSGPSVRLGSGESLLNHLAGNGGELGALVRALDTLQAKNQEMGQEMAAESDRLQSSAAEIRQIALHTRMVAMNATIEAARAGGAGRAFAVIVADMRNLAARTAEASDQCSSQAKRLHEMVRLTADARSREGQHDLSVAWAQGLVRQVIERFEGTVAALHRSIADMEHERLSMRTDISRALVALQVQDRVSQILSHLGREMEALQADFTSGGWRALDEGGWTQRMAARFSTPEEFENLQAKAAAARRTDADSGITYF